MPIFLVPNICSNTDKSYSMSTIVFKTISRKQLTCQSSVLADKMTIKVRFWNMYYAGAKKVAILLHSFEYETCSNCSVSENFTANYGEIIFK